MLIVCQPKAAGIFLAACCPQEYTLIKMRVLELKGKLAALEGEAQRGSLSARTAIRLRACPPAYLCACAHCQYGRSQSTVLGQMSGVFAITSLLSGIAAAGQGPVFLMAATLR